MASPASLKLAKPFCTVPHARGFCDSFDQSEDGAPGPPGAALESRGGLTLAGLYRRVRSGARMGHAAGETPPIRSHEPPGHFGARPLTPLVHPGSNRGRPREVGERATGALWGRPPTPLQPILAVIGLTPLQGKRQNNVEHARTDERQRTERKNSSQ